MLHVLSSEEALYVEHSASLFPEYSEQAFVSVLQVLSCSKIHLELEAVSLIDSQVFLSSSS